MRHQPAVQLGGDGQTDDPTDRPGSQQGEAPADESTDQTVSNEQNDQEVYVVFIPRHLHHTKTVVEAKRKELDNFKTFGNRSRCWSAKNQNRLGYHRENVWAS